MPFLLNCCVAKVYFMKKQFPKPIHYNFFIFLLLSASQNTKRKKKKYPTWGEAYRSKLNQKQTFPLGLNLL